MSLETYVEAWRGSIASTLALLEELDEADWSRPTDLPGWDVHDVVAHLAHLEAVLAGHEQEDAPDAASPVLASEYTESGVAARRDRSPADLVAELRAATEARAATLATLPDDPAAAAAPTPASVPWSWDTLLRNRVVDAWCHEQDLRRAVGRPGGLDSPAAVVTAHTFAAGMPYVVGKKVGAGPGTSVRWDVHGDAPLQVGVVVTPEGRAKAEPVDSPDAALALDLEAFTVLAAGRRGPDDVDVTVVGDEDLARRVLDAMTLTF